MSRFFSLRAAVAMVVGCVFNGCASLSPPPSIGVSVITVRPLQASLLETSVEVTLRLTNEGVQPLALAGATHRLYLNGTYVGRGVSNERVAVPPLGTATHRLTLYLENLTLMRKFSEYSDSPPPTISYRLDSQLHGAADGGTFKSTTSGELDVAGLMNMAGPIEPTGQPARAR